MSSERQAQPHLPPPGSDEISLRDLYLILKRNALAIVAFAMMAGLVAFVFVSRQPARYVGEATAVIARAPADVDFGSGLRFRPEVNIGLDTYRTLAFSRPVLQELSERFELPFQTVESRLELKTLSNNAAFLAVDHIAYAASAERAAAVATAWAAISVQRARDLLLENLDAVEMIANQGLAAARSEVEDLEGQLEASRNAAAQRLGALEVETSRLRRELVVAHGERSAALRLEYDVETLQAQRAYLELALPRARQALAAAEVSLSEQEALLAALRQTEAAGGGADALVLASAPEVTLSPAGALASVAAMVVASRERRDALSRELADYTAELRASARAEAAFEAAMLRLDQGLAIESAELERALRVTRAEVESALERERSQLERALGDARRDYDTLSPIEPGVALAVQIAPSGARVLAEASVPMAPEGNRALLIALLALLLAGFAGVMVALLAEAVRDPHAPTATQAQAIPAQI